MASRIKGITVESGGDTTGSEKTLKSVKQYLCGQTGSRHESAAWHSGGAGGIPMETEKLLLDKQRYNFSGH